MRRIIFPLALLVILTLSASARADIRNLDPVENPLGDCSTAVSADDCMALTSNTLTCTDSWGCPQCGMNDAKTGSLCYRLFGNYGFCSCTANGIYYDKYGNIQARCTVKGACNVR